jgi:hypothetical protein
MPDQRINSLRTIYAEFKKLCGWNEKDLKEMDQVIKQDLTTEDGYKRDFQMSMEERIVCWRSWLECRVEDLLIEKQLRGEFKRGD